MGKISAKARSRGGGSFLGSAYMDRFLTFFHLLPRTKLQIGQTFKFVNSSRSTSPDLFTQMTNRVPYGAIIEPGWWFQLP